MTIATEQTITMPSGNLGRGKKRDWREIFFRNLFLTAAIIGVLSLATIGYFIFVEGMPAIQEAGVMGIVTGSEWLPPALYGIAPMIVASLASTIGAVAIGVPVAVLTAVFIAEIAPKWLANIIRLPLNCWRVSLLWFTASLAW